MSDRSETHSEFDWPSAPEQGTGEVRSGSAPPQKPERHSFIHYANSRYASCVRCGRAEHDLIHRVEN